MPRFLLKTPICPVGISSLPSSEKSGCNFSRSEGWNVKHGIICFTEISSSSKTSNIWSTISYVIFMESLTWCFLVFKA